ncbi:MAG TPA: alpha/beta hydrolase, partial [Dehalococcoidia bacterium]|nr:alpha/beta hydrolase [Dehalococcoidia bacterium]
MFEGFEELQIEANGTTINLVKGGSGPPMLMLHGYPQTHAMWNKIAPRFTEDFTVVCPDLRGYGDSAKVEGDPEHMNYSKRVMAQDQVDVMKQLGFEKFYLVGHDRGGRVSHRLTKDHPEKVLKLVTLDIIPTHKMFQIVDKDFATNTYHWFFLIQPFDFPERVIGADPEFYAGR